MKKFKVMIADNNPILLQQLTNVINCDNQMELIGSADNGKDAYSILEKGEPNVVLFDLLLPYYDGFALLDKIKLQDNCDERMRLIMTTSLTNDAVISESYKRGVDYIIAKPYDVEAMATKIKKICTVMDRNQSTTAFCQGIDVKISKKLNQIGIPARLKGYRYMITAMKEILRDETMLEGVTKILYPAVAKKHNSTPQRVEKAIRHAIEVGWKSSDNKFKKEFEYSLNSEKVRPTNSEFIAVLSQQLKMIE